MRIAIVTGASSGIGREFARQIPRLYCELDEIWLVARREGRLSDLKEELSVPVRIFAGDLKRDAVYESLARELILHHPDVRMLVNAAGCGKIGAFTDLDMSGQLNLIDINCRALTRMTGLCLSYMTKGSRLVQVASAAAFGPQPGFAVYAATKSYVYSLSRALSKELRRKGIFVTAVCPGPVDTEFFEHTDHKSSEGKKALRVPASAVVHQALVDAVNGKEISVYGLSMKAARLLSGIVPDRWIAAVMGIVNGVDKKQKEEGIER